MRLIDADALIDEVKHITGQDTIMWFYDRRIKREQKVNMAAFIELMPTIDPAENGGCWGCQCALLVDALVKHGEWIDNKVAFHFVCSECGCTVRMDKGQVFDRIEDEYNYCPNCGAKMDGGEE